MQSYSNTLDDQIAGLEMANQLARISPIAKLDTCNNFQNTLSAKKYSEGTLTLNI